MIKLRIKTNDDREFKEAVKWFEVAFNSPAYITEPDYTCFTLGGYELALYPEKDEVLEKPRTNMAYVGVKDISTIFNRLISMGANVVQKPFVLGGQVMIARVRDPFGHILCLIDDPSYT
ncbi:VOC family protein [Sphingobacterium litopenaei]|uniref:VOC family protein n=1 Tax=Sphingobacterium litopenaei TaxID=2763500 RepID=A0ABR7YBQ8_9SPHI|nr:VOC family protein [Sphingobacterium litopenaei]MBD1428748.1 VOC family protein [Sphingobacterium litopenaei]